MKRMFNNGRYANVAATLALVFALGGTSYAAYTLPHNSVGSWQIRTSAVKNSDLGYSSVTSGKVRDGTLQTQDFAIGVLQPGPQGSTGPQGPAGPAGPASGATAYARIAPGGGFTSPAQYQGIGGATFTRTGGSNSGNYCVSGLPFQPRSAIVTIDSSSSSGFTTIASTDVAPNSSTNPYGCSFGDQVSIKTVDATNGSPQNSGFYIWLEK